MEIVNAKKLYKYTLIILLCIFQSATVSAIDPETEEDPYFILMGEAEKAIANENYEEAAARLIDAIGLKPGNPSNLILMSNLGMVYSCLDRDSLAIATLDEVNRQAPKMTAAIMNRARIKLKINDSEGAYEDFSKVIELDSMNTDARYFRGMMALYGGKKDMAEEDFKILEQKQPTRIKTYAALGTLYSMTGREREAVKYLTKLIEVDPNPEFYATLAGCYLVLEELSDASTVISEGLKRYSHDPELYYYRAWLNRDRFRLDEAHEDAKLAIAYGASPERVKALFDKSGH